mgnify:FL=1
MKIRKTRQELRETYRYEVYTEIEEGVYRTEFLELKPGENGVTEAWIKTLHSLDDHEVYMNCKNSKPPMTDDQKAEKREWEEAHPGQKYMKNWNLSLDYISTDDEGETDKSKVLKSASYLMEEEVPADVQRLRDVVETMTDKQKQVYQYHVLEGLSFTEIAKLMGTSVPNVTKHFEKAKDHIRKNF